MNPLTCHFPSHYCMGYEVFGIVYSSHELLQFLLNYQLDCQTLSSDNNDDAQQLHRNKWHTLQVCLVIMSLLWCVPWLHNYSHLMLRLQEEPQ